MVVQVHWLVDAWARGRVVRLVLWAGWILRRKGSHERIGRVTSRRRHPNILRLAVHVLIEGRGRIGGRKTIRIGRGEKRAEIRT
jgi:hypothetical protein